MKETIEVSTLVQSRTDDGAEAGVFGDGELDAEIVGQALENAANGGDGGEVVLRKRFAFLPSAWFAQSA